MTTKLFLTAVCAVLIAACGGGASPGDGTSTTAGADTTTTEEQAVTTTQPEHDPELAPVVEQARADLVARIDVAESSIEVVLAEPVTWSDGSLGCPEEGKMYTQALVEGSRVVLEHDETRYEYHAGADDEAFLCPEERAEGPVQG